MYLYNDRHRFDFSFAQRIVKHEEQDFVMNDEDDEDDDDDYHDGQIDEEDVGSPSTRHRSRARSDSLPSLCSDEDDDDDDDDEVSTPSSTCLPSPTSSEHDLPVVEESAKYHHHDQDHHEDIQLSPLFCSSPLPSHDDHIYPSPILDLSQPYSSSVDDIIYESLLSLHHTSKQSLKDLDSLSPPISPWLQARKKTLKEQCKEIEGILRFHPYPSPLSPSTGLGLTTIQPTSPLQTKKPPPVSIDNLVSAMLFRRHERDGVRALTLAGGGGGGGGGSQMKMGGTPFISNPLNRERKWAKGSSRLRKSWSWDCSSALPSNPESMDLEEDYGEDSASAAAATAAAHDYADGDDDDDDMLFDELGLRGFD